MNTLKSGALIVVLLVVLYGVFVALSKPDRPPLGPSQAAQDDELAPPLIDYTAAPAASEQPNDSLYSDRNFAAHQTATTPSDSSPSQTPGSPVYDASPTNPPAFQPSSEPSPTDPAAAATDRFPGQRSSYEYSAANTSAEPAAPPLAEAPSAEVPAPEPTSSLSSSAATAESSAALAAWSLKRDLIQAEQLVADRRLREALALLTPYHAQDTLGSEERAALMPWLDALAAKVIYSRDHVLALPHKVRNTESLFDIAGRYGVGWQLLQSINGLAGQDPRVLVPGTELKVLPGPFRADASLSRGELTLYLGDLYAGRFPVSIGNEPPPPGSYKVVDKREDRTYIGLDGRTIAANDPANPYGGCWISLGGEVSIHGSPLTPATQTLGCISLSPRDARDVYGILTVGSEVTIRR